MRRAIILLTLICYLGSIHGLVELTKLEFLFEHYSKHKNENPGLSLLDFVANHYSSLTGTEPDSHENSKLPFKTSDPHLFVFLLAAPLANAEATFEYPVIPLSDTFTTYSFSSGILIPSCIWQPPRVA